MLGKNADGGDSLEKSVRPVVRGRATKEMLQAVLDGAEKARIQQVEKCVYEDTADAEGVCVETECWDTAKRGEIPLASGGVGCAQPCLPARNF